MSVFRITVQNITFLNTCLKAHLPALEITNGISNRSFYLNELVTTAATWTT
jgi:hypothetical protein